MQTTAKITPDDYPDLLAAVDEGISQRELACRYGCAPSLIARHLSKARRARNLSTAEEKPETDPSIRPIERSAREIVEALIRDPKTSARDVASLTNALTRMNQEEEPGAPDLSVSWRPSSITSRKRESSRSDDGTDPRRGDDPARSTAHSSGGRCKTVLRARATRIAELIDPVRFPPGAQVDLARDFEPVDTGDLFAKKDSAGLLEQGVDLLAHYQWIVCILAGSSIMLASEIQKAMLWHRTKTAQIDVAGAPALGPTTS